MSFFDDPRDIAQRKADAELAQLAARNARLAAQDAERQTARERLEREVASAAPRLRSAAAEFAAKAPRCGVAAVRYPVAPDEKYPCAQNQKYRLYVDGVSARFIDGWWLATYHHSASGTDEPMNYVISQNGRLLGGRQSRRLVKEGWFRNEGGICIHELHMSSADSVVFAGVTDPPAFERYAVNDMKSILLNGATFKPKASSIVGR